MSEHKGEHFWRIRMRYTPQKVGNDYSEKAWSLGQVGIWYGDWSVKDFEDARKKEEEKDGTIEEHLNQISNLGLEGKVGKREIDTVKRFFGISNNNSEAMSENDWVVVCSDDEVKKEKAIHLGRLKGTPKDSEDHELNKRPRENAVKERWKFREVIERKSFPLSALPDFYRLIPQYGRQGNIFQFRGNYLKAVSILARCKNVMEVQNEFRAMDAARPHGPRSLGGNVSWLLDMCE